MSVLNGNSVRLLGAYCLVLTAGLCTTVLYVADAALPHRPVSLPGARKVRARVWAPEGWGFFTRNPREEDAYLYVLDGRGAWTGGSMGPAGRPSNLFGLSRGARAQGMEVGQLLSQIPLGRWKECKHLPSECLESAATELQVRNGSPTKTLCGAIGLALQPPVPWAWRGSRPDLTMSSKVIRLDSQC